VPLALGDYARAEALSRRAVEINLATIGGDHPSTATTRQGHGLALWRLGRLGEAEKELRTALTVREKTAGKDSYLAGAVLAALARVVSDAGRADEALALARRAATIGESHAARWPSEAAAMVESLALVLGARGDAGEAQALWRRALELREGTQDSGPIPRALARAGLGEAALRAGDPRGLADLRAAAAVLESLLPEGHPDRRHVRELLDRPVGRSS
jgi:tetratricopeptide (TPR) repeat protein